MLFNVFVVDIWVNVKLSIDFRMKEEFDDVRKQDPAQSHASDETMRVMYDELQLISAQLKVLLHNII